MTQEQKQLLLKDLCARLPYETMISCKGNGGVETRGVLWCLEKIDDNEIIFHKGIEMGYQIGVDEIKPFLRPMSSMNNKELSYYNSNLITKGITICEENMSKYLDWIYSHHFDYCGLIPMGLALEAPKDMYNTKTE